MAEFTTFRIAPDTYYIQDEGASSFYVVEGSDRAAVIDTGITPGEKILPVVRKVTDKPLILALTHAHIDHFHHMDEFDTVYMSHREFALGEAFLRGMMAGKDLDLASTIDIRTGSVIELGGETLEVCEVPGHTPGSVVFWAQQRDLLFTGDAIGSGYGVWMHGSDLVPLDQYYHHLVHLMKWLVERGGRMKFYGGHNMQQFLSAAVKPYNPLTLGLLADLIDLVDGIVKGEIVGRPSDVTRTFSLEPVLYASFGRAEIQYLKSNIHTQK